MPKKARTAEDIEEKRNQILDTACDLICDLGFEQFSMRKLAARVGMSATNLYNYFSGKDEIYLAIQTRGFAELHGKFTAAGDMGLKALIDAYLAFGTQRKDYYDIMFSWNTPKFADYLGTQMENLARREKQAGLKVVRLTEQVLKREVPGLTGPDLHFHTIRMWTGLHGVVSLLNSRVLSEVVVDPQACIDRLKTELLSAFKKR